MPLEDSKTQNETKIRFRSSAKIFYSSDSKIEDLLRDEKPEMSCDEFAKKEYIPSLWSFLNIELTRDYQLDNAEERFSARREKIYSFMRIPKEVERFMRYGLMQCADSFLYVYTFLPIRVILALWALVTRPFSKCFGIGDTKNKRILTPAEICDLLKAAIIIVCSVIMFYVDTNMLYHLIKSQSVIKLYMFYNMLEIGDRLFSSFGQDAIDSLFWTATEPRGRKREHLGTLPHLIFAVVYVSIQCVKTLLWCVYGIANGAELLHVYIRDVLSTTVVDIKGSRSAELTLNAETTMLKFVFHFILSLVNLVSFFLIGFLHSLLVLFQSTTINVAINSRNKALMTIMMSNNFVELKGSVFKKFDKNNLFQVSCSDVRERFHLTILLFIVILQTMREYSWKTERFWVMLPDCFSILLAEMFVDWIKHAFITRFNELNLDVYRDYTTSLAYDVAQTRQKHAFSDHSDLVARRMGFIPLPLGVVIIRVFLHSVRVEDLPSVIVCIVAYMFLVSFKVLISLVILSNACSWITQHKLEKASLNSPSSNRCNSPLLTSRSKIDMTPSPLHPVVHQPNLLNNGFSPVDKKVGEKQDITTSPPNDLGPAAIFANSTVDLKNASLNEELLKVEGEDIRIEFVSDDVTRSFPNINSEFTEDSEKSDIIEDNIKRSESEPNLNKTDSDISPK